MDLRIKLYPTLAPIADDERLSRKLMEMERDVWGYKTGTSEYSRCTNNPCSRILSTEDVYGASDTAEKYIPLQRLESNGIALPCCPDCQSSMELVLKPETFLVYNQVYFRKALGALLLDEEETPHGMVNGMVNKPEAVIQEIDYRNSYQTEDCVRIISQILGEDVEVTKNGNALCLNKILILPTARGGGFFRKLIQVFLELQKGTHQPLIADTSFTSRYYRFMRAIAKGYQIDVATDEHGWVLTVMPDSEYVRQAVSLTKTAFEEEFGKYYREAEAEQRDYIKQKKPFEKPKHYQKVLRLPNDPQILLTMLQR